MDKIFKELEFIMMSYKHYRFLITEQNIELKITPWQSIEEEQNWAVKNNELGKKRLLTSLQKLSAKIGQ